MMNENLNIQSKIYEITLDTKNPKPCKVDNSSKAITPFLGDSLILKIKLLEDGKDKKLENTTVKLFIKKADDTVLYQVNGITVVDKITGDIEVVLHKQATTFAGTCLGQLELTGADGSISTGQFMYRVYTSLQSDTVLGSKNEIVLLEDLDKTIEASKVEIDIFKKYIEKFKYELEEIALAGTTYEQLNEVRSFVVNNLSGLETENLLANKNILELKDLEISLDVKNDRAEINILELDKRDKNLAGIIEQNLKAEENISEIKLENNKAKDNINNLISQNNSATDNNSKLVSTNTSSVLLKGNLEATINRGVLEKDRLDSSIRNAESSKNALNQTISNSAKSEVALKEQVDKAILQDRELKIAVENAIITESRLEDLNYNSNQSINTLDEKISSANSSNNILNTSIGVANNKLADLDVKNNTATQNINSLTNKITTAGSINNQLEVNIDEATSIIDEVVISEAERKSSENIRINQEDNRQASIAELERRVNQKINDYDTQSVISNAEIDLIIANAIK